MPTVAPRAAQLADAAAATVQEMKTEVAAEIYISILPPAPAIRQTDDATAAA